MNQGVIEAMNAAVDAEEHLQLVGSWRGGEELENRGNLKILPSSSAYSGTR